MCDTENEIQQQLGHCNSSGTIVISLISEYSKLDCVCSSQSLVSHSVFFARMVLAAARTWTGEDHLDESYSCHNHKGIISTHSISQSSNDINRGRVRVRGQQSLSVIVNDVLAAASFVSIVFIMNRMLVVMLLLLLLLCCRCCYVVVMLLLLNVC